MSRTIHDTIPASAIMANLTVSHPFYEFDDDDHTALVASITLIFALFTITSIIAKLVVRRGMMSLQFFDYILFGGALVLLIQTALVLSAAKDGLGQHSNVDGVNTERIRKYLYGASILGIIATTCTKVSMCLLIKTINDNGRLRIANRALLALIVLFCLSGMLATIFQCPLPSPWLATSTGTCPSVTSIYLYVNVNNVITDVLLCLLAVAMIWKVQTSFKKKAMVVALFFFRVVCPATAIPSLLETQQLYNGPDDDFTWLSVTPIVWLQASYNLSVITVCIPSIKVIFDSFFDNGTHMTIDTPYQLTTVPGKRGLHALAYAHSESKAGTLKLTVESQNQAACYSEGRNNKKGDDGQSESVQNLTEGIIIREDFEVLFDDDNNDNDDHRASSQDGSHISDKPVSLERKASTRRF